MPADTNQHRSILELRELARSKLAQYDAFFFTERRRTTVLLAALFILLTAISAIGLFLIKEDGTVGLIISLLATFCAGLVASLTIRQSPSKAVQYLANRDELRRLIRQLELYIHLPETFDTKQVTEITRTILELLGKEEENHDHPTDKQSAGVVG